MTFDRQPLAFFDRRPEDRMMIHITAIRAIAPSRIHSHVSDEVVLAAGEVVGEGAGVVGGGAVVGATVAGVVAGDVGVGVGVGAGVVGVGVGVTVSVATGASLATGASALLVGRLMLAVGWLMLALPVPPPPQPVARNPAASTAISRTTTRRMFITALCRAGRPGVTRSRELAARARCPADPHRPVR